MDTTEQHHRFPPFRALVSCLSGLVLLGCASLPEHATVDRLANEMEVTVGQPVYWQPSPNAEARLSALLVKPLTPESAVQVALLHSRSLQQLFAEYGLAQADYLTAASLPNPLLDVEVLKEGGVSSPNLDVAIVQHFLAVLRLKASRQIADAHLRAAALRLTSAVLALREGVLKAYYNHVASKQMLEMRLSVAESAGASYEFASKLREAGNIRAVDLSNEQALYEAALVALANAEADVIVTRERLGRELELWRPDQAWSTPNRLPKMPREPVNLEAFESQVVGSNLHLSADQILVDSQYRKLGLERSTRLIDDLELGVVGEREEGEWERGLGFGWSLPIFQQGQPRILKARSQLAAMESSLYLDALDVRSMAREAATGLRQTRRLVEHDLDVRLPLATRILQQTQLEVNAMQTGLFELMVAKQRQIEAGAAFVRHLNNYWIARVVVDQLLAGGTPSMGGMMADEPSMAPANDNGGH